MKKYMQTAWFDVFGRERIKLMRKKMRCRIWGRYLSKEEKNLVFKILLKFDRGEQIMLRTEKERQAYSRVLWLLNDIDTSWRRQIISHEEAVATAKRIVEQDKLREEQIRKDREKKEKKEVIMRKIRRIFRSSKRGVTPLFYFNGLDEGLAAVSTAPALGQCKLNNQYPRRI